jgi:hypothetical protein
MAIDMKKNALLATALVIIIILGTALVRVENQRYAMFIGMCIDPATKMGDSNCLASVETRAGWWWHLYYAITA